LANGLQVPAAESPNPTADGKIYVDSAHLKFVNDLEVAAQADGLITQMDADEGDLLKTNSLMIQLDDRLANSELQVTQKEYEAAVEKSKDDSEIQYSKAAHDVAREEYNIAVELDRKGAGTATELSKKWLEDRRAGLAITVAQLKNKQDVLAVGVSEAKQGAAKVQVDMRKIVAPFDGIVAEKRKEQHDWVRAGDVILRLVSMEQLRVVGQVRVSQLSAAPHELLGAPAVIDIELYPGKSERVTAKVGFVSPVMESSGGYRIWLQIPNVKANDQWVFREGMPARIEIATR
jgi:multidrug resistance efflux pump